MSHLRKLFSKINIEQVYIIFFWLINKKNISFLLRISTRFPGIYISYVLLSIFVYEFLKFQKNKRI